MIPVSELRVVALVTHALTRICPPARLLLEHWPLRPVIPYRSTPPQSVEVINNCVEGQLPNQKVPLALIKSVYCYYQTQWSLGISVLQLCLDIYSTPQVLHLNKDHMCRSSFLYTSSKGFPRVGLNSNTHPQMTLQEIRTFFILVILWKDNKIRFVVRSDNVHVLENAGGWSRTPCLSKGE